VGGGFDRSRIVTRGEGDGGDAVHDAFVVCNRPEPVGVGKLVGSHDPTCHCLTVESCPTQSRNRNTKARAGPASRCGVGEDRHKDGPAAEFLQGTPKCLCGGVDDICAHGVPGVYVEIDNEQVALLEVGQVDASETATTSRHGTEDIHQLRVEVTTGGADSFLRTG